MRKLYTMKNMIACHLQFTQLVSLESKHIGYKQLLFLFRQIRIRDQNVPFGKQICFRIFAADKGRSNYTFIAL